MLQISLTRGEAEHLRRLLRTHMMTKGRSVADWKSTGSAWPVIFDKLEAALRAPADYRDYKMSAPPS